MWIERRYMYRGLLTYSLVCLCRLHSLLMNPVADPLCSIAAKPGSSSLGARVNPVAPMLLRALIHLPL